MKFSTAICLFVVVIAVLPAQVSATSAILDFIQNIVDFFVNLFNVLIPGWLDDACAALEGALGTCTCTLTPSIFTLGVGLQLDCTPVSGCIDPAGTICATCTAGIDAGASLANTSLLTDPTILPKAAATLTTNCEIDSDVFTALKITTDGAVTSATNSGFDVNSCNVQTSVHGVQVGDCTCTVENCGPLEVFFTCNVLGNDFGTSECTSISLFN